MRTTIYRSPSSPTQEDVDTSLQTGKEGSEGSEGSANKNPQILEPIRSSGDLSVAMEELTTFANNNPALVKALGNIFPELLKVGYNPKLLPSKEVIERRLDEARIFLDTAIDCLLSPSASFESPNKHILNGPKCTHTVMHSEKDVLKAWPKNRR